MYSEKKISLSFKTSLFKIFCGVLSLFIKFQALSHFEHTRMFQLLLDFHNVCSRRFWIMTYANRNREPCHAWLNIQVKENFFNDKLTLAEVRYFTPSHHLHVSTCQITSPRQRTVTYLAPVFNHVDISTTPTFLGRNGLVKINSTIY